MLFWPHQVVVSATTYILQDTSARLFFISISFFNSSPTMTDMPSPDTSATKAPAVSTNTLQSPSSVERMQGKRELSRNLSQYTKKEREDNV